MTIEEQNVAEAKARLKAALVLAGLDMADSITDAVEELAVAVFDQQAAEAASRAAWSAYDAD